MLLETKPRPLCSSCGIKPCKKAGGKTKMGFERYQKLCATCGKIKYNLKDGLTGRRIGYRKHKKPQCESCGFIPVHMCQLDVDHKDGNKHNDDPDNLQTLCANCHRLKTQLSRKTHLYK